MRPRTPFPIRILNPAVITLLLLIVLVALSIILAGGSALDLARLGTIYSHGDPNGSEGYDGQFVYYIARDPHPSRVKSHLDAPAYRYQRILLPIFGYMLSLGNEQILPWILVFLVVLSQAAGTWAVGELLRSWGMSRWYALTYGLWVGFLLSIAVLLPEPLAFALCAGAVLARVRKCHGLSWLLFGLALFAKEVTLLFVLAAFFIDLYRKRWRNVIGLFACSILPFGLFQAWLWVVFGSPGIGSGGALATPFEFIPFMGLFRIGSESLIYLVAMLAVFGPTILWPTLWSLWSTVRSWLSMERSMVVLALFFNSLSILFLPFSTFRETGGLLRFACGLVLALIIFAGRYQRKRVLNYSVFWLVLNVFLVKSLS